ncbi:MAG: catechol 2,3-dioxygenase [Sulfobacillus sp.]|nr:catechol 2,3-dioxygenase [Sulfobacillus sp.]
MMGISRLGFVQVRVTDLEEAKRHYIESVGLEKTEEKDGKVYLKGWDEWDHHSVVVEEGGAGLVKMAFKVDQAEDLAELERRIEAYGLKVDRVHRHEDHAVGDGIKTTLPSGHVVQLYHEAEVVGTRTGQLNPDPWPDELRGMGAPRLDHLLVSAEDPHEFTRFFTDVLDFKISEKVVPQAGSDQILAAWLFRTNTPHDVAVIPGPNGKLHHFAFYLDNWNELLKAGDVMSKHRIPIDVGPTRHGITRGQTIYFFDPAGNRNEVFSGGYITYRDFPCITWTADQLGTGIFYHNRELNERFTSVLT